MVYFALPATLRHNLAKAKEELLQFIFTPHCASCHQPSNHPMPLCHQCWGKLDFEIPLYLCAECGFPLSMNDDENHHDNICLCCMTKKLSLDGTYATLAYDDMSKPLIMKFKYHDALYLRELLSYLLALSINRLPEFELIIPVPLHPLRLWSRRYNQAGLLAFSLAKLLDSQQVLTGVLKRTRYRAKQSGNPKERYHNLKNTFHIDDDKVPLIKGKDILLLDDVLTTGATMEHCAALLKAKGAGKIYGLAIARVARPRPIWQ